MEFRRVDVEHSRQHPSGVGCASPVRGHQSSIGRRFRALPPSAALSLASFRSLRRNNNRSSRVQTAWERHTGRHRLQGAGTLKQIQLPASSPSSRRKSLSVSRAPEQRADTRRRVTEPLAIAGSLLCFFCQLVKGIPLPTQEQWHAHRSQPTSPFIGPLHGKKTPVLLQNSGLADTLETFPVRLETAGRWRSRQKGRLCRDIEIISQMILASDASTLTSLMAANCQKTPSTVDDVCGFNRERSCSTMQWLWAIGF